MKVEEEEEEVGKKQSFELLYELLTEQAEKV